MIDSDSRIESYIPGIYSQPGDDEEEGFEKFQFRQQKKGKTSLQAVSML